MQPMLSDRKRILIVDDDPSTLAVLSGLAASSGYAVSTTTSAREFLTAFDFDAPDAAMLDVVMPEEDCFQIIRALAIRGFKGPVIILTSYGPSILKPACDYGRALQINVVEGLPKPIDVDRLRSVLWRSRGKH